MDLQGQSTLVHKWIYNETSDVLTIQFWDSTQTTFFGDLVIEGKRFRALMNSVGEVGMKFFPDIDFAKFDRHRTVFKTTTNAAVMEFNS